MTPPRGHAEPRELVAYHARQMAETDAERLRDHLALCSECSELLLDLIHFDELEMPEGVAEPSEGEVVAALEALYAQLGEGAPPASAATDAPVLPFRGLPSAAERAYRPAHWQLIVPWTLAASMAAVSLTLWLRPPALFVASAATATRSAGSWQVLLVVFRQGELPQDARSPFQVVVREKAGSKERWRSEPLEFEGGSIIVGIPPRSLPSGTYQAHLLTLGDPAREVGSKEFRISDS